MKYKLRLKSFIKIHYFAVVFMAAASLFAINSEPVYGAESKSTKNIYCDPIVRSKHSDFQKLMTEIRGMPNAEIISSTVVVVRNNELIYYALVCSKK